MNMNEMNALVWLVLALALAWAAYNKIGSERAEECQAYDSLGHGIGCEGWDMTDL